MIATLLLLAMVSTIFPKPEIFPVVPLLFKFNFIKFSKGET